MRVWFCSPLNLSLLVQPMLLFFSLGVWSILVKDVCWSTKKERYYRFFFSFSVLYVIKKFKKIKRRETVNRSVPFFF